MLSWDYYTERNGLLYADNGEREVFDGKQRTASEWDAYLETQDIRGNVR